MKNKPTALISVFNKKGIAKFALALENLGYRIIATEGTGRKLAKRKISYIPAETVTKNPEGFDDCIKTISFRIQAGILFDRKNQLHRQQKKKLSIQDIDLVACNFVTLEKAVKRPTDFNIKHIDVGGPLMVRAAATNFKDVLVVVDPADYEKVIRALSASGATNKLRQQLAIKAFAYTGWYDSQLVKYLKVNKDLLRSDNIKKKQPKRGL